MRAQSGGMARRSVLPVVAVSAVVALASCSSGAAAGASSPSSVSAMPAAATVANPYDVYVTTVHQRLVHAPEIQRSEAAAEVAQTCSNTGRDMAALIQDRTSSGADPAQALAFVDDRAAFVMAYCPSERQPLDAASMALFDYTSPI